MTKTNTVAFQAEEINNNLVAEGFVTVNGVTTPYAILRNSAFEIAPPKFVGYLAQTQEFFLSDETPEDFRDLVMAHEVFEFTLDGGPDGKGNCLKALLYELTLVPDSIYTNYIRYRREFFAGMVNFIKEDCTRKRNMTESLAHLKELLQQE
ncbi:MAG: hypothetical protein U9Q12_02580 [Patescibacteria group bacterium]|nr:hypothetical protein [Patescibacteria group bacterium]